MSVIISNTTPINYLVLIDHTTVLCDLYGRVLIPQAVFGELQNAGTPDKVKAWVASHPAWLEVRAISTPLDPSLAFLDEGEIIKLLTDYLVLLIYLYVFDGSNRIVDSPVFDRTGFRGERRNRLRSHWRRKPSTGKRRVGCLRRCATSAFAWSEARFSACSVPTVVARRRCCAF